MKKILLLLIAFIVPAAMADDALPNEDTDQVVQLLQLIQQAANTLDYSGVYTWQSADRVIASRITHIVDGSGVKERVVVLDGEPREFIRVNQDMQCLLPETKEKVRVYYRSNQFPGIIIGQPRQLQRYYHFKRTKAMQRVAGRPCVEYWLTPRKADRNEFRLCVDRHTNLLMKIQQLNNLGKIIEQIAFTDVAVGPDVQADQVRTSYDIKNWTTVNHMPQLEPLNLDDWRMVLPPGFSAVSDTRMADGTNQYLFADGITSFSVFITKVRRDESTMPQHNQEVYGNMRVYRDRTGQYWVTAVGSVPETVLETIASTAKHISPLKR